MNEIYFEVPHTTNEVEVCIPHNEDFWTFKIVFFESKNLDWCMVTVIGECKENGTEDVQTLTSKMDEEHDNEFGFEFEATYDVTVKIEICEDRSTRTVRVVC